MKTGINTAAVLLACAAMLSAAPGGHADGKAPATISNLKITILSTMLAEAGIGEWGFAALVEADSHRILFDTGGRPDTVLKNVQALGIDLTDVTDVILSHNHLDHTGGLVTLREELGRRAPTALTRAHVGRGIFWERPGTRLPMTEIRKRYEALGGTIIEYDRPQEVVPGIWLTGPVPRIHPEKNYGNPMRAGHPVGQVISPDGIIDDNIPESMSMVIRTRKGLVVLSGCGHAGMINTLEYAQKVIAAEPVHAAIGGFHLLFGTDAHLQWTADKLVDLGLENFVGAHCTGIEPVYRFRELTPLNRSSSVVGAVGASFTLDDGIHPLNLAR